MKLLTSKVTYTINYNSSHTLAFADIVETKNLENRDIFVDQSEKYLYYLLLSIQSRRFLFFFNSYLWVKGKQMKFALLLFSHSFLSADILAKLVERYPLFFWTVNNYSQWKWNNTAKISPIRFEFIINIQSSRGHVSWTRGLGRTVHAYCMSYARPGHQLCAVAAPLLLRRSSSDTSG